MDNKYFLSRKRQLHADNATLASHLFNSNGSLVITSNGLSLRISPAHPYYSRFKDLIGSIAADHVAKRTFAELALKGEELTDEQLHLL